MKLATAALVAFSLTVPAFAGAPLTSDRPMPRPDYIGKTDGPSVTPLYLENWDGSRGKLYGWRVIDGKGKKTFVSNRQSKQRFNDTAGQDPYSQAPGSVNNCTNSCN